MQPQKTLDSSTVKRIVVGVVFGPLIVWIFWQGGYPLFALLALLTLLGQWEFFRMLNGELGFFHHLTGYMAGLAIVADAVIRKSEQVPGILVTALIIYFIIEIITGKERKLRNVSLALLVTIYPAAFIVYLFQILLYPGVLFGTDNRFLLFYLVLVIWTFDTTSYFAGRFWGKHPFFPQISPKKTMEGFWGGMAGVLVFGAATALFTGYSLLQIMIVSVLAGFSGQAGDLSESIIKRDVGIKDSSHIIPGHGGVLDRFDSLFFAAPVIYLYLLIYTAFWR
ncbi:MAG: phosphatidate cytidylyltransferase [Candidatus Latescibacter sp.]|nr:phosphatidate cytidylyltransferase [Candidatus Latescibacter sp.]